MEKNSFILRNEYLDIFTDLSDKQAGILIKTVYTYAVKKEMPAGLTDEALKMAFKFIKKDIDYDTKKYNDLCESRKNAVAKRWEQSKSIQSNTKDTSVYKCIQKHTKDTSVDFVIHSDSEGDSDYNNTPLNNIPPKTVKRFVKPTVEEIKAYCAANNYSVDAQNFFDFYESKGWKVGNTPMKNWQAAIRNWVRSDKNKGANNGCIDYNGKDADLGKYANFLGKKY